MIQAISDDRRYEMYANAYVNICIEQDKLTDEQLGALARKWFHRVDENIKAVEAQTKKTIGWRYASIREKFGIPADCEGCAPLEKLEAFLSALETEFNIKLKRMTYRQPWILMEHIDWVLSGRDQDELIAPWQR